MGNNSGKAESSWTARWLWLGRELRKRTCEPLSHPSFVMYFVAAVVGVGGFGIWVELFKWAVLANRGCDQAAVELATRTAVATFFPALAGAASMQLIWGEEEKKFLRAFATLVLVLLASTALVMAQEAISNSAAFLLGAFASVFALWLWWIANAHQPEFQDIPPPVDAPIGGPPDRPLQGDISAYAQ